MVAQLRWQKMAVEETFGLCIAGRAKRVVQHIFSLLWAQVECAIELLWASGFEDLPLEGRGAGHGLLPQGVVVPVHALAVVEALVPATARPSLSLQSVIVSVHTLTQVVMTAGVFLIQVMMVGGVAVEAADVVVVGCRVDVVVAAADVVVVVAAADLRCRFASGIWGTGSCDC